jgi:hypothetical protein
MARFVSQELGPKPSEALLCHVSAIREPIGEYNCQFYNYFIISYID